VDGCLPRAYRASGMALAWGSASACIRRSVILCPLSCINTTPCLACQTTACCPRQTWTACLSFPVADGRGSLRRCVASAPPLLPVASSLATGCVGGRDSSPHCLDLRHPGSHPDSVTGYMLAGDGWMGIFRPPAWALGRGVDFASLARSGRRPGSSSCATGEARRKERVCPQPRPL